MNKNKIIAVSITFITIIILAGITYTFFSASVSNTNNEKLITETATMSLVFDDNDNGVNANLNLGDSVIKKFTLENTGSVDAYAKIKWYNLVNTYLPDSLSWTLEQSETENGTYILVGSGKVPISPSSSNKHLKSGLLIPVNKTYYYKLTITLNNLDINQSNDLNATMHSQFSLSTEADTGVDTIEKLAAGKALDNIDVIYASDYEYETKNRYVLSLNGFISTTWRYNPEDLEYCQEDLEYFLEDFGPTVSGECQINHSTGKYNLNIHGLVTNPIDNEFIFKNQNECEDLITNWGFENATCENVEYEVPIIPAGQCTYTLAYDGTTENNLRYVGSNPCNYVSFNGEDLDIQTVYRIVEKSSGNDNTGEVFDTEEDCNSIYSIWYGDDINHEFECQPRSEAKGGWRIIGIMNNIDDGEGNLETRIKLVRNSSLGGYSWDTSDSTVNNGWGVNDWTKADLMYELNGDYLNTSLNANTYWYNGQNNKQTEEFDYTKRLSAGAGDLIGYAKWHLGGNSFGTNGEGLITTTMYTKERGTEVWGSTPGQICNDGACPRATSWIGKVALIYPSDFGFATTGGTITNRDTCIGLVSTNDWRDYSDCYINDWITPQVSLTPTTDNTCFVYSVNHDIFGVDTDGRSSINPAVYLASGVKITGGNGSPENPYTLD